MMVFTGVYYIGAIVETSDSDATQLRDEFEKLVEDIGVEDIFFNNFRIAATMFIPGFGIAVGVFSAFSTGMVFNAIVQTTPELTNFHPLAILTTPFAAIELFSYGIAMSRSGILINAIIRKHNLKSILRPTLIELGVVAALVLSGAFIEFYMIETLKPETEIMEMA
ncbi:MAG: stage II sporulation protein M [Thaumarchaeota archaeon]|nr:hypothetical protein [Nitrososphaerota archaeon]NMJ86834.1 stage II sporulation protein M [Nitrososphaerota archaeon]